MRNPWARSVAIVAVATLSVSCSSDGGGSGGDAEEALASAKTTLDETTGVTLSLTTDELPDDVDGILEARGVGTSAPAFEGDLVVVVNGLNVEVPVVSVDGTVHAKLPFTREFAEVDPGDYGAPDPADLMDPDIGISSWLTGVNDLEQGDRVRDGETVLSSYSGSLPGKVVAATIPSADPDAAFPVTFRIDDDGRLRVVEVSGPFYGAKGTVDYTVGVDDYGSDPDITSP